MTINKVTVLGAGTMGAQLAALFVNAGLKVKLLDIVVDKNDPNLIAKNLTIKLQIRNGATIRLKSSESFNIW